MAQDLKSVSSNASFDPETVNLLSDAFEGAWQRVKHQAIALLDQAMPM